MTGQTEFNILLAETDSKLSQLLATTLEGKFGATVYEASDPEGALRFLTSLSNLSLVIVGDAAIYSSLQSHVTNPAERVQSIFCVKDKLKDPTLLMGFGVIGVVERTHFADDVVSLIQSHIFSGEIPSSLNPKDFCRIPTALLLQPSPLEADTYISLSGRKFLKIFSKGDRFEGKDFTKYAIDKKVSHFFIKQSDSKAFMDRLQNQAQQMLAAPTLNRAAATQFVENTQDIIHDSILKMGVTDQMREMTSRNVEIVIKLIGNHPRLSTILESVQKGSKKYIPSHSLFVAEIACSFAALINWPSDLTFQKLAFAALLHDMTLRNDEVAKARTLDEVRKHKELLIYDTLDDVASHPARAAKLLQSFADAPPDVDIIVTQHHEAPDGSGFPNGITHKYIAPLSCVFIVAHHFVTYLMEPHENTSLDDFLERNAEYYSVGTFAKVIRALQHRSK
jgi:hypothetical protein